MIILLVYDMFVLNAPKCKWHESRNEKKVQCNTKKLTGLAYFSVNMALNCFFLFFFFSFGVLYPLSVFIDISHHFKERLISLISASYSYISKNDVWWDIPDLIKDSFNITIITGIVYWLVLCYQRNQESFAYIKFAPLPEDWFQ